MIESQRMLSKEEETIRQRPRSGDGWMERERRERERGVQISQNGADRREGMNCQKASELYIQRECTEYRRTKLEIAHIQPWFKERGEIRFMGSEIKAQISCQRHEEGAGYFKPFPPRAREREFLGKHHSIYPAGLEVDEGRRRRRRRGQQHDERSWVRPSTGWRWRLSLSSPESIISEGRERPKEDERRRGEGA